jgi:hypothetical protein
MRTGAKKGGSGAREGCPVFESERGHELYERRKRGHRVSEMQRIAGGSRNRATESMDRSDGEVYNKQGIP